MTDRILQILKDFGVGLAAPVPLGECDIIRPYKLERAGFFDKGSLFAVMLAIPYLTQQSRRNISAYATARDYHLYFKELFSEVIPMLEKAFPENRFAGFADDSPINERDAAAKAGLGIIGDNGMLITEKYSSYVFLGEIVTDLPHDCSAKPVKHCQGCGKCRSACPMGEIGQCLSALTQKKGELTPDEERYIKKYGSAWGCDMCQKLCPHTLRALKQQTIYTDVEFFKNDTIPYLTVETIDSMDDGEFAKRAYSWRKRETVRRNLEILEK